MAVDGFLYMIKTGGPTSLGPEAGITQAVPW